MTEPRNDYVGEGGDGTDPELPLDIDAPDEEPTSAEETDE